MGNRTLQGNRGNTGEYKVNTNWDEGGIQEYIKLIVIE